MKRRIIYFIILLFIFILSIFGIFIIKKTNNHDKDEKKINQIQNEEKNVSNEEIKDLENLKIQSGIEGDTSLYEVQKDYNNSQVAVIKPSIKYKVAFAGMINKRQPEFNELDTIIKTKHPQNCGIWIEKDSQDEFLNLIKSQTNFEYKINENGYISIQSKNKQNEIDKKLEKIINGNKLYIISFSSVYYIVDDISGEILDYNFEKIDKYQIYEYIEDNDKSIIFISENSNNILDKNDIFTSLIDLIS